MCVHFQRRDDRYRSYSQSCSWRNSLGLGRCSLRQQTVQSQTQRFRIFTGSRGYGLVCRIYSRRVSSATRFVSTVRRGGYLPCGVLSLPAQTWLSCQLRPVVPTIGSAGRGCNGFFKHLHASRVSRATDLSSGTITYSIRCQLLQEIIPAGKTSQPTVAAVGSDVVLANLDGHGCIVLRRVTSAGARPRRAACP